MSQKQLDRLDVINQTIRGSLTAAEAADALGLSTRQIKRLKKDVITNGPAALIHKNSLRRPSNAIPQQTVDKILDLKRSPTFKDANFKHFQELLDDRRRKRKPQAGLLLQVDAAPFAWFKDDKTSYALHGAINDAAGQITALYLCKNE